MAIALDNKRGRNARQWNAIRNKVLRSSGQAKGLTGRALEAAVMSLAAADSSLVKIEAASAAGAQ